MYGKSDIERLSEKLGYEKEVLKLIANQTEVVDGTVDPTLIELVSGKRDAVVGAKVAITVGDSIGSGQIEKLLNSILALAFLSCFKILDGIVEWILECNVDAAHLAKFRWPFDCKIQDIKNPNLVLPPLLDKYDWLKMRTFSLYTNLIPFRNEVVHRHKYEVLNGVLVIEDTKEGHGVLQIDRHKLGSLARFIIGLGDCLTDEATLDKHLTLLMRYYADQIADIHGMIVFDQKEPLVVNVKLTVPEEDGNFTADLEHVRRRVKRMHPGREVLFNLTLCAIRNAETIWKWEIPYDAVPTDALVALDGDMLPEYRVAVN